MRRWSYAVILALIIASVYLQGCAETAIVAGGKIYLDKERAPIFVTENPRDVAGCDFKKTVDESRAWGGIFLQDDAMDRVIADLTTEASEAGGNVLLIRKKHKGFWGSNATAEAYHCPDIDALATPPTPKQDQ